MIIAADYLAARGYNMKTCNTPAAASSSSLIAFAATSLHKPSFSSASHFRETPVIGIIRQYM